MRKEYSRAHPRDTLTPLGEFLGASFGPSLAQKGQRRNKEGKKAARKFATLFLTPSGVGAREGKKASQTTLN